MSKDNPNHEPEQARPKTVLTLLAQQYGLTIDDLVTQGIPREDIIVETPCKE